MENQNNKIENQEKKTRGRPKTVAGVYDSKKYYNTFKTKNEAKIKEKINCPICNGLYSYYNKSHHTKSNVHQMALLKSELKTTKEELQLIINQKPNTNIIIEDN